MARAFSMVPVLLLAACNPANRDLSRTIMFQNPAECRLGPDTLLMFGELMAAAEGTGSQRARRMGIAGFGVISPTVEGPDRDGMVHVHLPLSGRWHGLTIVGIAHGHVPDSGVSHRQILFAEPPDAVRAQLNAMGFRLPDNGAVREFGDGMTEYMSVDHHEAGAALICGT